MFLTVSHDYIRFIDNYNLEVNIYLSLTVYKVILGEKPPIINF